MPGTSEVITGGISNPVNSSFFSGDFPPSTSIYEPDNKVSMPETPLVPMRGRTTQNRESWAAKLLASLRKSIRAITRERSSARAICRTTPISTCL
ncbi:Uncharacterised protein [Acinetobacter baumannii]|nr:Uncharacterised protein [Acinetobacter baumannii]